jgi:aminoglycoside phosphotransferase (APT) family kinase protein
MTAAPLDPLVILDALGARDITSVTPVLTGWDAAIWRIERSGQPLALRVLSPQQHRQAEHEVAAMCAVRALMPVPEVHISTAWEGRPVIVMDWLPGDSLADAVLARPRLAPHLGVSFGQAQARLHSGRLQADLTSSRRDWIVLAGEDERSLQEHLRRLVLRDDTVLHLDYHPANVLVDGGRVTGVLDWANAAIGDPRADLARTYSILRASSLEPVADSSYARAQRAFRRGWWRGYVDLAGSPGDLAPFIAWAGAYLLRDLTPKLGQPGVWLEPRHLDSIREWTAAWKRRAGIG